MGILIVSKLNYRLASLPERPRKIKPRRVLWGKNKVWRLISKTSAVKYAEQSMEQVIPQGIVEQLTGS